MADDLFNIKNEFFLGNFQGAINEAQASDLVLSSPADEKDRDVIVRSSISGIFWHAPLSDLINAAQMIQSLLILNV